MPLSPRSNILHLKYLGASIARLLLKEDGMSDASIASFVLGGANNEGSAQNKGSAQTKGSERTCALMSIVVRNDNPAVLESSRFLENSSSLGKF